MTLEEAVAALRARLEGHPGVGTDYGRPTDWGCVAHSEGQNCCVDEDREALLVVLAAVSKELMTEAKRFSRWKYAEEYADDLICAVRLVRLTIDPDVRHEEDGEVYVYDEFVVEDLGPRPASTTETG